MHEGDNFIRLSPAERNCEIAAQYCTFRAPSPRRSFCAGLSRLFCEGTRMQFRCISRISLAACRTNRTEFPYLTCTCTCMCRLSAEPAIREDRHWTASEVAGSTICVAEGVRVSKTRRVVPINRMTRTPGVAGRRKFINISNDRASSSKFAK